MSDENKDLEQKSKPRTEKEKYVFISKYTVAKNIEKFDRNPRGFIGEAFKDIIENDLTLFGFISTVYNEYLKKDEFDSTLCYLSGVSFTYSCYKKELVKKIKEMPNVSQIKLEEYKQKIKSIRVLVIRSKMKDIIKNTTPIIEKIDREVNEEIIREILQEISNREPYFLAGAKTISQMLDSPKELQILGFDQDFIMGVSDIYVLLEPTRQHRSFLSALKPFKGKAN